MATADSPDQGASGIPVDSVELTDDMLKLALVSFHARYEARLAGDKLAGTFTQYGRATPLELTKRTAPVITTLDGIWMGAIPVGGQRLRLIFKIKHTADGWAATVDSPAQNVADSPADSVTVEGDHLKLVSAKSNVSYEARLDGDTLVGTFTQNGIVAGASAPEDRPPAGRPAAPSNPPTPVSVRRD